MALSGIESRDEVREVVSAGASAVLVGSSLMRAADPTLKLKELIAEAFP